LIDKLFAGGVLDPELAQIGADAVDRALVQLAPLAAAGFVDGNLMDEEPLFKTRMGKEDISEKPLIVCAE